MDPRLVSFCDTNRREVVLRVIECRVYIRLAVETISAGAAVNEMYTDIMTLMWRRRFVVYKRVALRAVSKERAATYCHRFVRAFPNDEDSHKVTCSVPADLPLWALLGVQNYSGLLRRRTNV